jgi:hypothetical protein
MMVGYKTYAYGGVCLKETWVSGFAQDKKSV